MKKLVTAAMIAVFCLVSVPALAAKGGQGGNPNLAFLELMPHRDVPLEYAAAWGKVKYTLSGPNLVYTLKAYGLVPFQEYYIYTCSDISGVGAADERGEIYVSGSVNGEYHFIGPNDVFTVRLANRPSTVVLISDEHGYDWR